MGNVWFLPSIPTLELWLKKVGFKDVQVIDVTDTSTEEQRSTDWMTFHSLAEFLDPERSDKTIEGYVRLMENPKSPLMEQAKRTKSLQEKSRIRFFRLSMKRKDSEEHLEEYNV